MKALSENEVADFIKQNLSDWTFENNVIKRDLRFKTFVEAFSFMTAVALESEKLNHHPDWKNVYNTVSIELYTHDANGITKSDFELAGKIDKIFKLF